MINPNAPLLDDSVIRRCKNLSVALLLDGLKAAGIDIPNGGCMDSSINPVIRGMNVVGTALTVETQDGDNFPIHVASYFQSGEGYVMVIDGKGYKDRAYFGDLIMGACKASGFLAMVIDGYTRDRDGNIELDFPVYSKGFMPRGPIKKDEGNINTDIMCAGVKVSPGDLVCGDSDGVCVIPRKYIDIVLEKAEEKLVYENKRHELINQYKQAKKRGEETPNLAPEWVLKMLKVDC